MKNFIEEHKNKTKWTGFFVILPFRGHLYGISKVFYKILFIFYS